MNTRHLLALLGLFSLFFLFGCDDGGAPQQGLTTVTYMTVQPRQVTLTTELAGRTSAFMVSEVRPQVSGIIQQRLFVEGSDVEEGDVLYQIDPAVYQAAYDSAKANLAKAEANVRAANLLAQRYSKLVRLKAVSKQEYDDAVASSSQARAEVSAAQAAVESARINLDYTKITAPVSGRIGRSSFTPGALVTQNQATPLATIQQLDPMYVDVTQSSTELLRLRRAFESGQLTSSGDAMQVRLKLEDGSIYVAKHPKIDPVTQEPMRDPQGRIVTDAEAKPVIGTLKFSEATVEQSTGAVTIRAVFPNWDRQTLLPGMYVRAVLEEGVSEHAIMIPQKAVVRNNRGLPVVQVLAPVEGQSDVFTIEPRIVSIDRSVFNEWLITDGLKAGDLILVEGLMRVRPGMQVRGQLEQSPAPQGAGTQALPASR